MQELDDGSRRLLSVLVGHISKPGVVPGKPESYITYKEARRQMGLPCHGEPQHHYGQCLKRSGMDTLGNWARDMGLPAITGLIVEQGSHEPGEGFFNLYPGTEGQLRMVDGPDSPGAHASKSMGALLTRLGATADSCIGRANCWRRRGCSIVDYLPTSAAAGSPQRCLRLTRRCGCQRRRLGYQFGRPAD